MSKQHYLHQVTCRSKSKEEIFHVSESKSERARGSDSVQVREGVRGGLEGRRNRWREESRAGAMGSKNNQNERGVKTEMERDRREMKPKE